jgi:hypothetical protein
VGKIEQTPFSVMAILDGPANPLLEEVHDGPTIQAELSPQIRRGWRIRFDLHFVSCESCYRED